MSDLKISGCNLANPFPKVNVGHKAFLSELFLEGAPMCSTDISINNAIMDLQDIIHEVEKLTGVKTKIVSSVEDSLLSMPKILIDIQENIRRMSLRCKQILGKNLLINSSRAVRSVIAQNLYRTRKSNHLQKGARSSRHSGGGDSDGDGDGESPSFGRQKCHLFFSAINQDRPSAYFPALAGGPIFSCVSSSNFYCLIFTVLINFSIAFDINFCSRALNAVGIFALGIQHG